MKAAAVILSLACAGCAVEASPPPVKVTVDTYCEVKRGLHGPAGKQTWSKDDTSTTIDGIARENAAVDKRCKQKKTS